MGFLSGLADVFNSGYKIYNNERNYQMQREQFEYNKDLSERQQNLSEESYYSGVLNDARQKKMLGINPASENAALSSQSMSGGTGASMSPVAGASISLDNLAAAAQIKKTNAETDAIKESTKSTVLDNALKEMENGDYKSFIDYLSPYGLSPKTAEFFSSRSALGLGTLAFFGVTNGLKDAAKGSGTVISNAANSDNLLVKGLGIVGEKLTTFVDGLAATSSDSSIHIDADDAKAEVLTEVSNWYSELSEKERAYIDKHTMDPYDVKEFNKKLDETLSQSSDKKFDAKKIGSEIIKLLSLSYQGRARNYIAYNLNKRFKK